MVGGVSTSAGRALLPPGDQDNAKLLNLGLAPRSMSLIFVRHGETALNAAQIVQPAQTPLSAHGLLQAEQVAERLSGLEIEAIVSSDFPRALQTALKIAARTGAEIEIDPIWRERDFGDWRGQPWRALGFDPRTTDRLPPGGESPDAFAERVAAAFATLEQRERQAAGALVVVTHGLVIRSLIESHLARAEPPGALQLRNTSVTIASRTRPHAISVLDCTAHLSAQEPAAGASGL